MVVDEVALESLDLVVAEHDLGELADAGVGAVHDLARRQLLLEHRPTALDPLQGHRGEFHVLAFAGNGHKRLYGERRTVQNDRHRVPFSLHQRYASLH